MRAGSFKRLLGGSCLSKGHVELSWRQREELRNGPRHFIRRMQRSPIGPPTTKQTLIPGNPRNLEMHGNLALLMHAELHPVVPRERQAKRGCSEGIFPPLVVRLDLRKDTMGTRQSIVERNSSVLFKMEVTGKAEPCWIHQRRAA